jgi:ethanolaminephosphotransferase
MIRIARRWNQTGQKFAGEPDIARAFFSDHKMFLWVLVVVTYLWNIQFLSTNGFSRFPQTASAVFATALATASATFKVAFTGQDSPELMTGLIKTMADNEKGASLVARARVTFIAIGISLIYTLATGRGLPKRPNRESLLPFI